MTLQYKILHYIHRYYYFDFHYGYYGYYNKKCFTGIKLNSQRAL